MTLTRLPGSKWWIETDETTFEIIGTYNKAQILADIAAIRATLLTYPVATQAATDVSAILNWITNNAWAQDRKDRATAMVNQMYQDYQGDPQNMEAANLNARLDALIALRDRLV